MILNLAILRRPDQVIYTWPILLGAIAPDAAIFVFYGWARGGAKTARKRDLARSLLQPTLVRHLCCRQLDSPGYCWHCH